MPTTITFPSRPFRSLRPLPFCPESEPKTQFQGGGPPFYLIVTNSSINTSRKSLRWYWLLKKLVLTTVRSYDVESYNYWTDEYYTETFTESSTTAFTFVKNRNGPNRIDNLEPYERVCGGEITPDNFSGSSAGDAIHRISFVKDGELCLHFELPIFKGLGRFGNGISESIAFFGLTTTNEDWGFSFYTDHTIPITFDEFTLYAKYVGVGTLDSATVDEVEFWEIEPEPS